MRTVNLQETMNEIAKRYQFNGENYPELQGVVSEEKILKFGVRHSAIHMGKTAGKVLEVAEAVDHGAELDIIELRINTAKMLVNTIKLAELLNMTAQELIELALAGMKSK